MARRRSKGPKVKKPKKVSYELIQASDPAGALTYAMLKDVIEEYRDELTNAQIVLAWNTSWKADVDGRIKLGTCKKASDLDRELVRVGRKADTVQVDFVIVLNKTFWMDQSVSDGQRRALLHHELCHAALRLDANGEPVEDERGRKVYRLRKHDLEEFCVVVERHGTYKRDLELFASALRRCRQKGKTLFDDEEKPQAPGPRPVPKRPDDETAAPLPS